MKKIILALMAIVICMGSFAQQPQRQRGERREFKPEEMAARQAERIKTACATTDEQYNALYNYFLRQAKQMQAQHAKMQQGQQPQRHEMTDEQRQAWREEAMKRQKAYNDSIKGILTAEQFTKYEKMMQEMRQHRPGQGGQGGHRGPRPQGNN